MIGCLLCSGAIPAAEMAPKIPCGTRRRGLATRQTKIYRRHHVERHWRETLRPGHVALSRHPRSGRGRAASRCRATLHGPVAVHFVVVLPAVPSVSAIAMPFKVLCIFLFFRSCAPQPPAAVGADFRQRIHHLGSECRRGGGPAWRSQALAMQINRSSCSPQPSAS
jgi:hypothetical protein